MEIIPVIDFMGGIVVQGCGGDRRLYPPLTSILTQQTQPVKVIEDLLVLHPFKTIYLADLEAIFDQKQNIALYRDLVATFPETTFWIDAGIKTQNQWNKLSELTGIVPVIGSETMIDMTLLKSAKHGILSLDFQYGEFLGRPEVLDHVELWPDTIIVMNIDHIGAQSGPDLALLRKIRVKRPDANIIAAGGVRDQQDLILLRQEKVVAVLIASALHDGRLNRAILTSFT